MVMTVISRITIGSVAPRLEARDRIMTSEACASGRISRRAIHEEHGRLELGRRGVARRQRRAIARAGQPQLESAEIRQKGGRSVLCYRAAIYEEPEMRSGVEWRN